MLHSQIHPSQSICQDLCKILAIMCFKSQSQSSSPLAFGYQTPFDNYGMLKLHSLVKQAHCIVHVY